MSAMSAAIGKVEGGLNKASKATGALADTMVADMAATSGVTKDVINDVNTSAVTVEECVADVTD
jgi:hypothetical protein